jgi:SAM-dependent methyltransferase
MQLLNAGCGTHYAKGWVNCDVWESDTTKPDVKVTAGQPYPFEDNYFDAIYLGHVIEHIDWGLLPAFLDDMRRIAKPGAPVLVVGPDIVKTIQRWSDGREPWHMVMSTLEHQDFNWQPGRQAEFWDGATHHWNCHHERVWNILSDMGFENMEDYFDIIPNSTQMTSWLEESTGIEWPVVAKWHWQFAIRCTA